MKTYFLPRIESSPALGDIRSDLEEREIRARKGCDYAVIPWSFYGTQTKITTHKTLETAEKAQRRNWRQKSLESRVICLSQYFSE